MLRRVIPCVLCVACAHAAAAPPVVHYPQEAAPAAASNPGAGPPWLDKLPDDPAYLFAIGMCGPTYYPDDAVKYAADKARANLGYAISSHVVSVTLADQTTHGTYANQASAVETTHDYTDSIVENSEIVATWIDRSGAYSGQRGTAYALAKLDKKKIGLPAAPKPADAPPPAAPAAPATAATAPPSN